MIELNGPTQAAGYIRVSTERQATEGLSLGEQERRIRAYADAHGWNLVELYSDAGISGRRDDRPALQRMLGALDRFEVLIIPKLDRLGRSNRHLLGVFDQLQDPGVQLVSLSESIDTSTPMGKLMRSLLSALAEFEADNISERVKAVTEHRAREGGHHGGPRPYGYRFEGGSLVVDDAEAVVVRRIFRDFSCGVSRREIARHLNEDGVPTARGR
jgi:site-specific DNA recombinase